MKRVMVKYKVKSERAEENAEYVRKVFDELNTTSPSGLRYVTFRLNDGVSFVHIASIETEDGNNPLSESPAFKSFQTEIKDRCEEPPNAVELETIGSYRVFE